MTSAPSSSGVVGALLERASRRHVLAVRHHGWGGERTGFFGKWFELRPLSRCGRGGEWQALRPTSGVSGLHRLWRTLEQEPSLSSLSLHTVLVYQRSAFQVRTKGSALSRSPRRSTLFVAQAPPHRSAPSWPRLSRFPSTPPVRGAGGFRSGSGPRKSFPQNQAPPSHEL